MAEELFHVTMPWTTTTLGAAAALGGGDVQTGPFGSQLHASDYVAVGIPSVMPQNIGDNRISVEGIARIRAEDAERLSKYLLRTGDIVYSRRGDIERRALIRPENDGWLCGTGCLRVRFGEGHVVPEYAAFYLGHPQVRAWIVQHAVGATMPNLNTKILAALPFVLPPANAQWAIADALASLDDKIELNRRTNETLEQMAQAIFRDWFVDFGPTQRKIEGATDPVEIMGGLVADPDRARELADLFPASFGDSGLPEGWDAEPLLDQAHWVNGAAYKNMHFSDATDALPVVKIAELKNGVTASTKRTNSALGERYRISNGELLFSWSGNPDTSIDAFIWTGGRAWLNQHIFAVRHNGRLSRSSLYILLKWLNPQFAEIARNKQTTGLGHVTKEDMRRLLICVPPHDVEAAFSSLTEPMIDLLSSRLSEIRSLTTTRDFLLPKLMSGEIRIGEELKMPEAAS